MQVIILVLPRSNNSFIVIRLIFHSLLYYKLTSILKRTSVQLYNSAQLAV